MNKEYLSLLRRGGVPLSAVAEVAGVARSSLYSWLVHGTEPKRLSDRIMLATVKTAIEKCVNKGTLPLPRGEHHTEIRRRIIIAIPDDLRRVMKNN